MQYARLRCNLSRAVGPVGIKVNYPWPYVCVYVGKYAPIPDVASLARREMNRNYCDKNCRAKRKKVSDSALVLGSCADCVTRNRCGGDRWDRQSKMYKGREDIWFVRLIAKSGLSFSNFPTSAGSFGTVSCTSWVAGVTLKSITPHEWFD